MNLTNFTVRTRIPKRTCTFISIDEICTGSSIQAWIAGTLQDFYKLNINRTQFDNLSASMSRDRF